jgi:hypothetical protein
VTKASTHRFDAHRFDVLIPRMELKMLRDREHWRQDNPHEPER